MLPLIALGIGTMLALLYSRQIGEAEGTNEVIQPPAKVSIVISAFNEECFIEETLNNILHQTVIDAFPEMFEIIVVDNESTDSTAAIASRYAHVIKAPRGKLNAMNAGVETANGDIILFMDADITAGPNILNLLLKHFYDPRVVAVSGSPLHHDDLSLLILDEPWNIFNSTTVFKLNGACLAVRKEEFLRIGGFNLDIDQFDRAEVQKEEEIRLASRLKQVGKVVVDLNVAFWAPPRYQLCQQCQKCGILNRYCQEIEMGQRF